MKKLLLNICLLALLPLGMLNAQTYIWGGPGDANSEFDGGLNDWVTEGLSSHVADSAANAVWVHTPDGLSPATLFGDAPIGSASAANGAALFDSEWLDHGGNLEFDADGNVVATSLGSGAAPAFDGASFSGAGNSGSLTSPMIDCTGRSTVAISYWSYMRCFTGATSVEVSNDGGGTWNIASNIPDCSSDAVNEGFILNISEFAADQDSVMIRFVWSGSYYFWMIDDVALIELPETNLSLVLDDLFYTPANAQAPACSWEIDTFFYSAAIQNLGGTDQGGTYRVQVVNNATGDVMRTDSVEFDPIVAGAIDTITITTGWAPTGFDPGVYEIVHNVVTPSADANPNDNSSTQIFQVTDGDTPEGVLQFAKENDADGAIGTWPDGGFYAIGVNYTLGSTCAELYEISNITYGVGRVAADPNPVAGRLFDIYLWELNTGTFGGDFDISTLYSDSALDFLHPSMTFIGTTSGSVPAGGDLVPYPRSEMAWLNSDGDDESPILEAGKSYALFMHWGGSGDTSPLHLFTTEHQANEFLFFSGGWFGGFTGGPASPILRMNLALAVTTDDVALEETAFVVYPNPTTDIIKAEIELSEASNATVTVATIDGKVIANKHFSKITNEVTSFDVSSYSPGTYLIRIATEAGTKTHKFVKE